MSADPEMLPKSDFRQGRRVARNVYHGDEPLFMAATDELAAELVLILNAGAATLRAPQNDGAAASEWRPMATAPDEGEFLVGLHVRSRDPKTGEIILEYDEQHVIAIDDETGEIDFAYEQGWPLSAYEFWKPLDPLPDSPALAQPDPSQEPGTGGER